jgi:glycosyltransferase involved in cell wall biosynthesis
MTNTTVIGDQHSTQTQERSRQLPQIVLVTNIPTPYRIPLFNALGNLFESRGYAFRVLLAARTYRRRKWQINLDAFRADHHFLKPGTLLGWRASPVFVCPGLTRYLLRCRPRVVITGGFGFATAKVILASLLGGFRVIIWSGSILTRGRNNGFAKTAWRRLLVRGSHGFIAYGSAAKAYLVSLGARAEDVTTALNTVDVDAFARLERRANPKAPFRVLYVGHFTSGKRIDHLLDVFARLQNDGFNGELILVGEGPAESSLRATAERLGISSRVRFEGFQQPPDLFGFFEESDCFVFPSEYDIWGLVLVEAMAAGMPCIASIRAGATLDLVQHGITGYAVDFSDTEKVATYIKALASSPEVAARLGKYAAHFIANNVTIEASAESFSKACERAIGMQ